METPRWKAVGGPESSGPPSRAATTRTGIFRSASNRRPVLHRSKANSVPNHQQHNTKRETSKRCPIQLLILYFPLQQTDPNPVLQPSQICVRKVAFTFFVPLS